MLSRRLADMLSPDHLDGYEPDTLHAHISTAESQDPDCPTRKPKSESLFIPKPQVYSPPKSF